MSAKLAGAIVAKARHVLTHWAATSVFQTSVLANITKNTAKGKYLQIVFLLLLSVTKTKSGGTGNLPLRKMFCRK